MSRPATAPDPALLALVRQCAIERDRWDLAYQQALQAARDGGWTLDAIARAAGVSRQGVHQMTRRPEARHGAPRQVTPAPWEDQLMSDAIVAFAWVAFWLYLLACGLWVLCELIVPQIGRRLAERRWTR